MSIKVIKDVLPKKEYTFINNMMHSEYFPWYYNNYKIDEDKKLYHYQLIHLFYGNKKINSAWFKFLQPLFKKLKIKNLLKVKANLNPISQELVEFNNHEDKPSGKNHYSIIYYINTNNGYTQIGNKKIKSKANQAVCFLSDTFHYGTNSTNCNNRMVLNIIYKKEY